MLLFVVDVSPELGFGHLTRCLNLARLNKHRFNILFLLKYDKAAVALLQQNRFHFTTNFHPDSWPRQPDLIIFDICRMNPEFTLLLEDLKNLNLPLLQITDLGLNRLPGVTIIDGSLQRYSLPTDNLYTGPDYMILHHKVRHFNHIKRFYRQHINHIFISLGGSTPYRLLRKTIEVFNRHHFYCKIAPGFLLKKNQKKILTRLYSNIGWVGHTESLARSLFQCDLAVIAPGVTAYEASATGTPALYLSHHLLQEQSALLFEQSGVGKNIGLLAQENTDQIMRQISQLSVFERSEMGERGKKLVDGLGLYRVNKILTSAVISSRSYDHGGNK